MNILLVGNGAREHIIAKKLAEDSNVLAIMSKKNPAIAKIAQDFYICDILNPNEVKAWASGKNIDLAFVSPDAALAVGITDCLESLNIPVASPTKDVADIECNKEFARELMQDHNIPGLAEYKLVESEEQAKKALTEFNNQVAIKPLGLTGGKGVKVSGDHFNDQSGALEYVNELLKKDGKLLIEEKLIGEEFTLQAFSDGSTLCFMPPVQDHKRAFNGDKGPNTGGMGSYSTGKLLPFMNNDDLEKAQVIMKKTIDALKKERTEFKGILYGQFMLTKNGPKIIEYNARFGDPEALNVLSLLKTPLSEVFTKIANGTLIKAEFDDLSTLVRYLVPNGYPTNPLKDQLVEIDESKINDVNLYYASVYEKDSKIYTTSSRSFAFVSVSKKLEESREKINSAISNVTGPVWSRDDIGSSELVQKRIDNMKRVREGS